MQAARRTLTLIVFLAPLIVLGWVAWVTISRYRALAEQDLGPVLEAEATRALGHEVRVGKVTIKGGYATVEDVRVAEGKTIAERGEIAHARRVVLDLDLRRILLSKDKNLPLIANVTVYDPVAHVRRSASERWNFEDLFKPRKDTGGRQSVGTIQISNGVVFYEDAALPRNPKRPAAPFQVVITGVNGKLQLDRDQSASWQINALGPPNQLRSARAMGTYEPNTKRLFLRIDAQQLALPMLARLLPPDTELTSGTGSGQLTLLRTVRSVNGKDVADLDYQADISVADGTVVSRKLGETVRGIGGTATVSNGIVTAKVDSGFAGSSLHAEGTVIGFQNPQVQGWASGSGVQLQRLLTALKVQDRVPLLRDLSVSANVRADVRGPLNAPSITAAGPVQLRGPLPPSLGGAGLGQEGTLQVSFSGSLQKPRIMASGTLPVLRWRDLVARNVWLSAVYTPERTAADFTGSISGGKIAGRADISPQGKSFRYGIRARLRGVNLAGLPLGMIGARTSRGPQGPQGVRGIVNADVIAQSRPGSAAPDAHAQVELTGFRYHQWTAASVHARLRSSGDLVYVEPLTLRDPKGYAVVTGSANLRRRTLALQVEANRVDLEKSQEALRDVTVKRPADRLAQETFAGLVFVRDGRVTGTFDNPVITGRLHGYNLGTDQVQADYAVTQFRATRDLVTLSDGRAYRFPAMASLGGVISKPLSKNPRVEINGSFEDVELGDLARTASGSGPSSTDLDLTGLAHGTFAVLGSLTQPEISLPTIDVEGARVGEYDFRTLTAAIRFDPTAEKGTWFLENLRAVRERPNLAPAEWTTVTASGSLNAAKRFQVRAGLDRVDLATIEPYISDYVTIAGTGDVGVELRGALKDGKTEDLSGTATARTQGLVVNDVAIGDLHGASPSDPAQFSLQGDRITSNSFAIGAPESGLSLRAPTTGGPAFIYDRSADTLALNGELRGIRIDDLRKALTNSPYIADHPENIASTWLKPITNPLEGTIGGQFTVGGTAKDPNTTFSWQTANARIAGNNIQVFEGTVAFNRDRIELSKATLQADDAVFNAAGTLVPNKRLSGNLDTNNLPIALVNRWFPGQPILRDLTGTAESVHLTAEGDPADPTLTASVLMKDVVWIETRVPDPVRIEPDPEIILTPPTKNAAPIITANTRLVKRLDRAGREVELPVTGRELWISNLDTSQIVVNGPTGRNKIVGSDLHVTLREPDPLTADPTRPRPTLAKPRTFLVYGSGSSDFDWKDLASLTNPALNLTINVPEQEISSLLALAPTVDTTGPAEQDIKGTIRAKVNWTNTLLQPVIKGELVANADLIRSSDRMTQLRDLNAAFDFTGDTVRVRNFTAYTEVVDPRSKKSERTPSPVRLSGELALNDSAKINPSVTLWPPSINAGRAALRLTADHLRFAEASVPGLVGARVVTNDTSLDLTVSGQLLRPEISGRVDIVQADIRLPEAVAEGGAGGAPLIQPSFNVAFSFDEKVRILSSVLNASVRTAPGAPALLTGDIHGGDVQRLRMAGTLLVDSGILAFPTTRFRIEPGGRVTLRYPFLPYGQFADPTLGVIVDITATTRLTASPVNDPNRQKRYTITAHAQGPLNSSAPVQYSDATGFDPLGLNERGLRLTFKSDPPDLALTSAGLQRRIVGLVGGESAVEGLFSSRLNIGRIARDQFTNILSNSFLPGLFDPLQIGGGFEEFTVDINQLSVFTLRLSRQLFGPVYLGYSRRIAGRPTGGGPSEQAAWEFKLSYRFRPALQFSFTTDDQRTNAYLLEGVFRF